MLILAGVAISVITSDGGLFKKTAMSAKEYKKQSIIETIKNAEFQLEIDKQIDKSIEKNITNLLEKLAEIGDINSNNYNITNNNLDEATIIDKSTGIVVDIKILPNGRVDTEASIVDDISDVIKPSITYSLDPDVGNYANEVKITINAKETTAGIVRIQFPDNTEKNYDKQKEITESYTVNKNDVYKFTAEGVNGRKISCFVDVRNAMNPADIELTLLTTEATKVAEIRAKFDVNLDALSNSNKYQYRINDGAWKNATANQVIKSEENGSISARYYDGKFGHKETSINISNVDKVAPNEFNLTTERGAGMIKVSGTTTDVGGAGTAAEYVGIRGYQFQLRDANGKILVNWTTEQTDNSYTFNNLESEKEYKVSMRALDKAGNIREATNNMYSVITQELVLNYTTKSKFSYTLTSSANNDTSRTPDKVFDGSIDAYVGCWHSPSASNQWLQIAFNQQYKVKKFTLQNRESYGYNIKNFYLQGSNNGSSWSTLQSFNNNTTSSAKTEFNVTYDYSSGGYKYYRWYAPYSGYVVIGELEMYFF